VNYSLSKILLTLLTLLSLASPSKAQTVSGRFDGIALGNSTGNVSHTIPGAFITVCVAGSPGVPCTNFVPIYSSPNLSPSSALPNPFNADLNGNFFFYTAPQKVQIQVVGAGYATYVYDYVTVPNDPLNPVLATLVVGAAPKIGVTGLTQCLHVNSLGVISGTGSDCGASAGAGVASLTGDGVLFNNSASMGAVTLSPMNFGAHKWYGNPTGSTGAAGANFITDSDLAFQIPLSQLNGGAAPSGQSYDFTGVNLLKLRTSSGLSTSVNGDLGYDSLNKNWHIWNNGQDSYVMIGPTSGPSFVNGDCIQANISGTTVTLIDAGAKCEDPLPVFISQTGKQDTIFGTAFSGGGVYVYPFYLPQPLTFGHISVFITSSETSGSQYDFGVINTSGTLLTHTGLQGLTGSIGAKTAAISGGGTVTLPRGWYYFCVGGGDGSGTVIFTAIDVYKRAYAVQSTTTTGADTALPSSITPPVASIVGGSSAITYFDFILSQ
jgi:hypothetical protein